MASTYFAALDNIDLDAVVGGEVTKVMSGAETPEDFTKTICDQMNTFFTK